MPNLTRRSFLAAVAALLPFGGLLLKRPHSAALPALQTGGAVDWPTGARALAFVGDFIYVPEGVALAEGWYGPVVDVRNHRVRLPDVQGGHWLRDGQYRLPPMRCSRLNCPPKSAPVAWTT